LSSGFCGRGFPELDSIYGEFSDQWKPRLTSVFRNTTIFFSGAAHFYGNLSTGPFTQFLIGTFSNFYLYRYRHVFWRT
jgi:hypothetical protein